MGLAAKFSGVRPPRAAFDDSSLGHSLLGYPMCALLCPHRFSLCCGTVMSVTLRGTLGYPTCVFLPASLFPLSRYSDVCHSSKVRWDSLRARTFPPRYVLHRVTVRSVTDQRYAGTICVCLFFPAHIVLFSTPQFLPTPFFSLPCYCDIFLSSEVPCFASEQGLMVVGIVPLCMRAPRQKLI